ncbi:histidine phosphatase family protein [Sporomusa sp. KB1]|uniref:histidine phosphatase family protein n=1 Tax=Sporomusa sp. KB1 TaxID=943346 RepID=UPI00119CE360
MIAESKKLSVTVRGDLWEMHLGKWEGKTTEEIVREYPKTHVDMNLHCPDQGQIHANIMEGC